MPDLTAEGRRVLEDLAKRHGVSLEAVEALLQALAAGNGSQAQFNHPDLGGMGQWSRGGMIMVGDMFNHALKARVDALCNELAGLLREQGLYSGTAAQSQSQSGGASGVSLFVPAARSRQWWPEALGAPSSVGSQNDLRYAWFAGSRRLAIQRDGELRVYDTGDHAISGFSQQQSGAQSLTFTSQRGVVRVDDLPLVSPGREDEPETKPSPAGAAHRTGDADNPKATPDAVRPSSPASDDIFGKLERLAELHRKGILSDDEFAAKKTELLNRI